MKIENWMSILMAIFFGFSALSMGFAQIMNAKATDKVLEVMIEFEFANYLGNFDDLLQASYSDQLALTNSQQVSRNYACLIAILWERVQPFNRTNYDATVDFCLNISSIDLPDYNDYNYGSLANPVKIYSESLEEIFDLRFWAFALQSLSVLFFVLGILCFIFLVANKAIDFSLEKRYRKIKH